MPAFAGPASQMTTTAHASPSHMAPRSAGQRSDEMRYAQREQASPDAKKYRGGDVIVISVSVLVVVLLIVLIIILI
jgi:hypothetical protein